MRRDISFATKSDDELSGRQGGRERLVNLYVEARDGTPSLRNVLGLGDTILDLDGRIEAFAEYGGQLYCVSGRYLHNVSENTRIGEVGTGNVTFSQNGKALGIVSGNTYSVYDGDKLSYPTVGVVSEAGAVAYIRGFMVVSENNGGRFVVSKALDAKTFDGLDFATAERSADDIVTVFAHYNDLAIFGRRSVEYWTVSGGLDFPLSPRGDVLERGCASGQTVAALDNSLFWLADDLTIQRTFEYQNQRVSTHSLERIIETYDPLELTGDVYRDGGHAFYVLRFPDRPAWCYDAATQQWHERSTGVDLGPWAALCTGYDPVSRRWMAGLADGRVVALEGRETELGTHYLRMAQSQMLRRGGERFVLPALEAHMRTGRGAGKVALQLSRDGERWDLERYRELGEIGEYERPLVWRGLGQYRELSARFKVTDPVDVQIMQVSAEIS